LNNRLDTVNPHAQARNLQTIYNEAAGKVKAAAIH
jgi:hypothetical protein